MRICLLSSSKGLQNVRTVQYVPVPWHVQYGVLYGITRREGKQEVGQWNDVLLERGRDRESKEREESSERGREGLV